MRTLLKHHGHIWDRLGIGASLLCLVHCMALPVLLITGGTVWAVWDVFHLWMAVLLIPVVLIAGFVGYRSHRHKGVVVLLGIGLMTILVALLIEGWLGKLGVSVITIAGGLLLIAGHWRNLALGTSKAHTHEHA